MSIGVKIKRSVAKAFDKLSDAQTSIIYTHVGTASYDPSTGAVTNSEVQYTVDGLLTRFKSEELESGEVHARDRKFTVLQDKLGFEPNFGADYVTIDGIDYVILNGTQDPYKIIWSMHLRER